MITLFLIIHVFVSCFLIFIVLIQGGKGAELGAAFGGSSQTLFGGRGAATFLNKLTTGVAIAFMVTSLLLTIASVEKSSVIKQPPAQKQQLPGPMPKEALPAPIAPAQPQAPTPPPAK